MRLTLVVLDSATSSRRIETLANHKLVPPAAIVRCVLLFIHVHVDDWERVAKLRMQVAPLTCVPIFVLANNTAARET